MTPTITQLMTNPRLGGLKDARMMIEAIKAEVRSDSDVMILLTGKEGVGKSTIGYWISLMCDPTFNAERMCFHSPQYIRTASASEKYQAIQLDEATQGAFNRGAMSKSNTELMQYLFVNRERNLIQIVCFPAKNSVDPIVLHHRCSIWIDVVSRGRAVVHLPVRSRYANKPSTFWDAQFTWEDIPPPSGPIWESYLKNKHEYVKAHRHMEAGFPVLVEQTTARIIHVIKSILGRGNDPPPRSSKGRLTDKEIEMFLRYDIQPGLKERLRPKDPPSPPL